MDPFNVTISVMVNKIPGHLTVMVTVRSFNYSVTEQSRSLSHRSGLWSTAYCQPPGLTLIVCSSLHFEIICVPLAFPVPALDPYYLHLLMYLRGPWGWTPRSPPRRSCSSWPPPRSCGTQTLGSLTQVLLSKKPFDWITLHNRTLCYWTAWHCTVWPSSVFQEKKYLST